MIDNIITRTLPRPELLAQLAEECSELAHAALKLRRALLEGANPTPIPPEVAEAHLLEELADVLLTANYAMSDLSVLEPDGPVYNRILEKNARWQRRMEAREEVRSAQRGGIPHGTEG